jgi:hypothetical protein
VLHAIDKSYGTSSVGSQRSFLSDRLLDTSQADTGSYEVTVSVNPSASTTFELAQDEPQRPQESSAPELDVPEGIAITKVYLPLIQR